jgi:serine/threonine-protein kinase
MATIGGGRYELGEPIASGAIGVVLHAVDTGTGEPVAIKRLRPETAGHPESVIGFLAEAEILAQLRHPTIVRLRELLSEPDGYALVLDLVPGADLRRRVRDSGPLPPAAAVQIVATVAEALGYLHGKGFLHGDIKPGNMVLPDDSSGVRLVDFGVSRRVGQIDRTTYATPEYAAPEVVLGNAPGTAADVYALGMVLYELCCGRSAYRGGTSDEVLNRHLTCVPVPPPGLPESVWPVVSACLALHPAHRPDAVTLPARLRALMPDLSALAAPEPLAADAVTWWPREADETAPILGLRRVAWVPAARQNPESAAPERMVAVPMPDDAPAAPFPTAPAPSTTTGEGAPGDPVRADAGPARATVVSAQAAEPAGWRAPLWPTGPTEQPSPATAVGPAALHPQYGAAHSGRAAAPAWQSDPIWAPDAEAAPPPPGSRLPLLVGVGAAVLVLLGLLALGGWLLRDQFTGDTPAATQSHTPTPAPTAGQGTPQSTSKPSGTTAPTTTPVAPTATPAAPGTPGATAKPSGQPTSPATLPTLPSIGAPFPSFP